MKHIDDLRMGQFAGLTFEIQRMLYAGRLDFDLVEFQLGRLTQRSMQGIVGQVPTHLLVRAPGSLEPTLKRLGRLDPDIPEEVIDHAIKSCAEVSSGTLLDVINLPLWMLGEAFTDTRTVFKFAKEEGLSSEHNSWLPFVLIDQLNYGTGGNVTFLLKKFSRSSRLALTASPGSTTRVRMEYPDHWFLFRGNSYGFVREA